MASEGLYFPCRIDVKVFLRHIHDQCVENLVQQLALEIFKPEDLLEIKGKLSRHGQYKAITCSVQVHERTQVDAFYLRLSTHEQVILVL